MAMKVRKATTAQSGLEEDEIELTGKSDQTVRVTAQKASEALHPADQANSLKNMQAVREYESFQENPEERAWREEDALVKRPVC